MPLIGRLKMLENAKLAIKKKKFTKALEILSELHQQQPYNMEVLEDIAKSYFGLRNFDKAIDTCNQGLSINGNTAWPHVVKSYILFIQKKFAACKEEAQIAFNISPQDWEPIFWWGSVLCHQGIDEGISLLEKAASLESNELSIYRNLSTAYYKKKDHEKYHWALEEINRIKPNLFLSLLIYFSRKVRLNKWH